MQGSGLTEIIPLMYTSATWGQYPVFSHPESPQGSLWGVAEVWCLLDGRYSLFPEFPSGLTSSLVVDAVLITIISFVYWCGRQYSISQYFFFFLQESCFSHLFLPSASSLDPAHPLGRTPQEGRRRQWLLGLHFGEFRWAHFSLRPLPCSLLLKCRWASPQKTELLTSLNVGCFPQSESEVAQLCPTLCNPVDCSPPGSSLHGILQARILEWVAIFFSRGSSRPRDPTWVSRIAGRHFNLWATREACFPQNPLSVFLCFVLSCQFPIQLAALAC